MKRPEKLYIVMPDDEELCDDCDGPCECDAAPTALTEEQLKKRLMRGRDATAEVLVYTFSENATITAKTTLTTNKRRKK